MTVDRSDDDYPRARLIEVDGKLVLDDPDALAVIQVVERLNRQQGKSRCLHTLWQHWDRVTHFRARIVEKGLTPSDVVIVLINVDDEYGKLADILMPGHDWQEYRDRGEIPYARGLANRQLIQDFLEMVDPDAGEKLLSDTTEPVVMVADHGVVEVYCFSQRFIEAINEGVRLGWFEKPPEPPP